MGADPIGALPASRERRAAKARTNVSVGAKPWIGHQFYSAIARSRCELEWASSVVWGSEVRIIAHG
jgi:hypothetical protein